MIGGLEGLELYKVFIDKLVLEHFEDPEVVHRMKWYKDAKEVFMVTGSKFVKGKLVEELKQVK